MKTLSIVSGGSSGLGLALAEKLVSQGSNVAIIGKNEKKLMKAKEHLKKDNNNATVLTFAGDITDEFFVKNTFSSIAADGWVIIELFNSAGVGRFGKPEDNTRQLIDATLGASIVGTILMSTQALNAMKESGGTIVNIMSSAALKGNPNETVYCASKWGERGYTEAHRAYLKGSNIKVVGVYPGGMNTAFWSPECGMAPDTNKFMNPSEVADEILYAVRVKKSMYVSDISIDRR